jgi:predicted transglutaminase-like cysteine proteinase
VQTEITAMTMRSDYLVVSTLLCVMAQPAASTTHSVAPAMTPMGHTFFCLHYADECQPTPAGPAKPSDAAAQWRDLQSIQARVNQAIVPQDDDSGPSDRNWLIWPRQGDCDDYAVTKRHELLQHGWPSSDVVLAEVSLLGSGKHHLVVVVHGAETEWVLDSRKPDVMRFAELRDDYIWLRVQSADNPKFWNRAFGELQMD